MIFKNAGALDLESKISGKIKYNKKDKKSDNKDYKKWRRGA